MDESTIEITQEKRERIIAKIKGYIDNNKRFFGSDVAEAMQTDYSNDNECWNKLLALIKSAPTKRNMKAVELADKLEESYDSTGNVFTTLCDVLGYEPAGITTDKDMKALCEAIRNLDAPEDGIPWPLDKDDVPIKPGDTVYVGKDKYEVAYIEYGTIGAGVRLVDSSSLLLHNPKDLTHKKPRILEDVKREVLIDNFTEAEQYKLLSLIGEAYEMGKAAKDE